MVTLIAPRKTAGTATTSAILARGTHTPVDATSGALTMTLPTNAPVGVEISVEKVDTSANAVTVSGTMRGSASSITLTTQYEARTFLSEGGGSWRPTSDHRTAASLNASYGRLSTANTWVQDQIANKRMIVKDGILGVDVSHPDFGGVDRTGGTTIDASIAIQAANDFAQAAVTAGLGAPTLLLPSGTLSMKTPITWGSAPIRSAWGNVGSRLRWDGAAGATVFTKDATKFGSLSYGGMDGVDFVKGANEPATWLDLTGSPIDVGFRLREVQFGPCSGDAIKIRGWTNLHWDHLRFDNSGGYCVRATTLVAGTYASFKIDGFTYDHSRSTAPGSGVICIDNTANCSNVGTFTLRGGRIEINQAMTGPSAIFEIVLPDTSPSARTVAPALEEVAINVSLGSCVFVHQTTAATTVFPSLILRNVRQNGMSATVTGSLSVNYPVPTLKSNYGTVALGMNSDGTGNLMSGLGILATSFGGAVAAFLRRGSTDTFDRWQLDETGKHSWGSGTAALDTNLYRLAANSLKTDSALTVGGNLVVTGTATVNGSPVGSGGGSTYQPPFRTATYIYPPVVPSTLAMTLGRRYYIPVVVPTGATSGTELTIDVTAVAATSSGGLIRMGIYTDNGTGFPGTLVLDAGTISSEGAVGARNITIAQALTPGRYYLALQPEVVTCTVRSTSGISPWALMTSRVDNATPNVGGLFEGSVTAGPFGAPSGVYSGAAVPLVGIKVA